jgi:gentisate 1,2-dioxygenase
MEPTPKQEIPEWVFYGREESERRKKARIQMKAEDIESRFEGNPRATMIVESRLGFLNRMIRFWINKVPAGGEEGAHWKWIGHRHTVEAVIYIKRGKGYSIIDGRRHDWEAGDFICVPYFAWHRHVNESDADMHYMACTTQPLSLALGAAVYEDERFPEYWLFAQKSDAAMKTLVPGGAEVPLPIEPPPREESAEGSASRLYEEQLRFAVEEENRRRRSRVIVKGKDLKFEKTRMGNIAYVVDPRIGFHVKTVATVLAEIPPQGRSGAHRHLYEEIEYVLSGEGYAVVEDRRYDWKTGDAFSIPPFFWHQHFNTGKETARFLVHTTRPGMENLGHGVTQQGEPAS